MSHAQICPICGGKGKIKKDRTYYIEQVECYGCSGKGWVTVL